MTAEVTREPTGGQELRHFLALRPLAAILADADNWRRATTGDPTQPEPLAMQARTLLVAIKRVRELHASDVGQTGADPKRPTCDGCRAECSYCESEHDWPCPTIRALDGEPSCR